jgi:hypothetical protein
MVQHSLNTTTRSGIPVAVQTGWDASAQGFFLIVERLDMLHGKAENDAYLFDSRELPESVALPKQFAALNSILDGMGVELPAPMLREVMKSEVFPG